MQKAKQLKYCLDLDFFIYMWFIEREYLCFIFISKEKIARFLGVYSSTN